MTYDQDPARWTASPEEAPELLRGAFSAAQQEGPSRAQMRSLALKIAAASAGGAVAVGTVKAASAGQAVATAASWSVGKVASIVALAGSLVTGAVLWQETQAPEGVDAVTASGTTRTTRAGEEDAPSALSERGVTPEAVALPQGEAPAPSRQGEPTVEPLGRSSTGLRAGPSGGAAPALKGPTVGAVSKSTRGKSAAAAKPQRPSLSVGRTAAQPTAGGGSTAETAQLRPSEGPTATPSEIELLRRAQVALQARPREAFQLTQEHRRLYPSGVFAQERDALAVQALMRAGESERARDLAESFIRMHPSSPHAHRFREAMGIR